MADGHLNKCKDCTRADVSANYRTNIGHYVEYEAKRAKQPKRRKARTESLRNRPHLKRKASYLTSNAIRDGRLVPQPCEKCGDTKAEAHHDDYSKPLVVRWLCRKDHLAHHGKESRAKISENQIETV